MDNSEAARFYENVYRPTVLASKQDFRMVMRLAVNDNRA